MWTFLLAHHVAAEVLLEVDRLLVHHAQVAGLIVGVEKLFAVVDVVDVAPAAAVHGLEKPMLADVIEHPVPVERKFEVAHGAFVGALGIFLVGQDDRGRNSHTHFLRQRVVEKLVVRRPPEGIVDDDRSIERGVFEKGAVEGDVVGDAVDDDGILRSPVQVHRAGVNEFGLNAFDMAGVDVLDQCSRKAVLHAEQNADLFHAARLLSLTLIENQERTVYGRALSRPHFPTN